MENKSILHNEIMNEGGMGNWTVNYYCTQSSIKVLFHFFIFNFGYSQYVLGVQNFQSKMFNIKKGKICSSLSGHCILFIF